MVSDCTHKYDVCRSAIVAWYYAIYFSGSAMVAAASGTKQETHAATAKVWQADLVRNNLVLQPFSLSLSSLVATTYEQEIDVYRDGNQFDLNQRPEDLNQAWGAIVSYLNGTAEYEKWKVEERVRNSSEFRALGVANFRTRVARELRDRFLMKGHVNFLVQAFRYRGKANYRDSIFLSYGDDRGNEIDQFISDLDVVAKAFLRMASSYCAKRVERGTWGQFVADLELNSKVSIDVDLLRR